MNKYLSLALFLTLLLIVTSCSSEQDIEYVTLDEIIASLPVKPIVVGFDIDDTVLFSSPGFYYGLTNKDGPDGKNVYGDAPLHSQKFWDDMNGDFDKFSLPKISSGELVKMHYGRGDTVVFITARNSSGTSILDQILMQSFGIRDFEIVFTSDESKTEYMIDQGVSIYYGDADSDIIQAKDALARPIRIMRSTLSTNTVSAYNPGTFGEEVLIHSDK